jgi:hypothetical protein
MPSDPTSAQPTAKSPLLAAIGLSLAIGSGAVLGTTDLATIEDAITGRWLTRAYTETQQGHTVAIAALEQSVGGVTREIDFVASRATASVRRGEDAAVARFARIDAEIAALKDQLAGVQLSQLISARPEAPSASPANENGLRSSLTELTAAHHNSVAAITRRLDRIEVKVGLSTDVTPVASMRKTIRRAVKVRRPSVLPPNDPVVSSPLDRGHLFNVRPVSQRGPLRLSKLPD